MKRKVTTKHLTGHCFTFVQTERKKLKKKRESQLMLNINKKQVPNTDATKN